MKVIAFNGSPRRGWNTATLLEKALEGGREPVHGEQKQNSFIYMTWTSKGAGAVSNAN